MSLICDVRQVWSQPVELRKEFQLARSSSNDGFRLGARPSTRYRTADTSAPLNTRGDVQ